MLAQTLQVITLSAMFVTVLVSLVIPLIVALVTKLQAAVWVKQAITGLLAAITALITQSTTQTGEAVISRPALLLTFATFILSQVNYVTLYQPHKVNEKILPNVGIGTPLPPPPIIPDGPPE